MDTIEKYKFSFVDKMRIYTVDAENIVNQVGRMIDGHTTEVSIQNNVNDHNYSQTGDIFFLKESSIKSIENVETPDLPIESIISKLDGNQVLLIRGGDGYIYYKYKYLIKRNGAEYIVVSKGLGIY